MITVVWQGLAILTQPRGILNSGKYGRSKGSLAEGVPKIDGGQSPVSSRTLPRVLLRRGPLWTCPLGPIINLIYTLLLERSSWPACRLLALAYLTSNATA